jgi:hypothetical protein
MAFIQEVDVKDVADEGMHNNMVALIMLNM